MSLAVTEADLGSNPLLLIRDEKATSWNRKLLRTLYNVEEDSSRSSVERAHGCGP